MSTYTGTEKWQQGNDGWVWEFLFDGPVPTEDVDVTLIGDGRFIAKSKYEEQDNNSPATGKSLSTLI